MQRHKRNKCVAILRRPFILLLSSNALIDCSCVLVADKKIKNYMRKKMNKNGDIPVLRRASCPLLARWLHSFLQARCNRAWPRPPPFPAHPTRGFVSPSSPLLYPPSATCKHMATLFCIKQFEDKF